MRLSLASHSYCSPPAAKLCRAPAVRLAYGFSCGGAVSRHPFWRSRRSPIHSSRAASSRIRTPKQLRSVPSSRRLPSHTPSTTPGSPPHSSGRAACFSVRPLLRCHYSPSRPTGRIISRLTPCAVSCGMPDHTRTSSRTPPPPSPMAPKAPLTTEANAITSQLTADGSLPTASARRRPASASRWKFSASGGCRGTPPAGCPAATAARRPG